MHSVTRARVTAMRLAMLIAVTVLPIQVGAASIGHAQAGQAPIVEVQSAEPKFPDEISFLLQARGFQAREAELNYSLLGSSVAITVPAEIDLSGAGVVSRVALDLDTYYVPPGATVLYGWTLTDEWGIKEKTPRKSVQVVDEYYPWRHLSDADNRVSVHWYLGGEEFGRSLIKIASDTLDRLEREIGVKLERSVDVWVYATQNELLGVLPKDSPGWAGGKSFPDLGLVLAVVSPVVVSEDEIKRIVPHELSHLVFYQATLNPYNTPPAWIDEGLAVHNQQLYAPQEEAALQKAAEEGLLVPLEELSGSFGPDEEGAVLAYAQSRSVIEFILSDTRYGRDKLAVTIAAFREGIEYDEALNRGLGVGIDELDQQWREYLPYKPSDTAPELQPDDSQNSTLSSSLTYPLIFLTLCLVGGMFMAGGVLTGVMLARRIR